MAIQWMDDFTGYGTDGSRVARLLDGVYAEAPFCDLQPDPDPLIGSTKYCMMINSNTAAKLRRVTSGPVTTVGIAERMWITSLPFDTSVAPYLCGVSDTNSNPHIYITVNPSGYLEVYRYDSVVTMIGTTTGPVVTANAWRHYETKIVIDSGTSGSVEVRIEGTPVITLTGIRTASNRAGVTASVSNVFWQNARTLGTGPTEYLKDVIIWDGTGTRNNTFMGSCQVYKILPDGDVLTGWTPNSGTVQYDRINSGPDDDTTYLTAPFPLPSPSQFTMTDLPANVSSVRGVQIIHRSRKTDGGDGNVQTSAITTGGTSNGTDRSLGGAYTYWWDVFDAAPGAVSWTKTLVDGLNVKINRTL